MDKQGLLERLEVMDSLASGSKLKRALMNPLKYAEAIFFREFIYRFKKVEKEVVCNTFFDSQMNVLLPASTDIFLLAGKSHISEIKLARFLINNLSSGDDFLDIGAHYGYFSLLASYLIGEKGKVVAFEAAPRTFKVLEKNKGRVSNMVVRNRAVSDKPGELSFYEFPNLFSEFNTMNVEQFRENDWFEKFPPKEIKVKSIVLDQFFEAEKLNPKVVKIDVEGAEFKVLSGAKKYLSQHSPYIVMEYLSPQRGNEEHIEAERLLLEFNFHPHALDANGNIQPLGNVSEYLEKHQLESDNIVFSKIQ
ncbi:MAG: FkbM family methyltransferase [Bacteroidetes bacterium]|nr:MAG: FkbM family methyltransferase [Bacteroidota bacterium]